MKETGHVSFIFVSKNMPFIDCYVSGDHLTEVNYKEISHLGNPNSHRVRLIEVTIE